MNYRMQFNLSKAMSKLHPLRGIYVQVLEKVLDLLWSRGLFFRSQLNFASDESVPYNSYNELGSSSLRSNDRWRKKWRQYSFDRPETIHLTDYLEQDRFSIMKL